MGALGILMGHRRGCQSRGRDHMLPETLALSVSTASWQLSSNKSGCAPWDPGPHSA